MSRSRSIHLTLHIHKDPAAMAERAAHYLAACCEEAISQRGVFTLALSGGKTPLPLFRLLAGADWQNVCRGKKSSFTGVTSVASDRMILAATMAWREVNCCHMFLSRGITG